MSTMVKWRAAISESAAPFTREVTTELDEAWATVPNADAAVIEVIAENYFQRNTWVKLFKDDWSVQMELRVSEPAQLAGRWLVHLQLKTAAIAARL